MQYLIVILIVANKLKDKVEKFSIVLLNNNNNNLYLFY